MFITRGDVAVTMSLEFPDSRHLAPLVVLLVFLGSVPGLAAAAPVQGAADTITVGPDETVDGVQAVAGTVIIQGTVTGDVQVAAGSLVIAGTVEGNVEGAAGSVDIQGRVEGEVSVGAGSLTVGEDGYIGGTLEGGAGSARFAGTVVGDTEFGAGTILLEPTATFRGDLRYDGELEDRGATVEGRLIEDESLGESRTRPFADFGSALFDVYGFVVTFVLGAVLLLAFPGASQGLSSRVRADPLTTGLYGLVVLVGIPILLILVAITIIGIPLAIVGALLFALAAWVASVYGRYAVGEWLLDYVDLDNRWAALLVGMVAIALVGLVPILGGLVEFLVLLLGLGGLAIVGRRAYRGRGEGAGS